MKRFNSLLWRGALLVVLFVAASVEANAQAGCTDSNACNFDAGAVTDDGSCTYTGWFIPLTTSGGPAIQACDAPAGYYFPDQTCVESVIAADPFCADPDFGTWDSLCEEAYNTCLGCTDPDFYIPYDIAAFPAVEACAGSEPFGYYLPDQTCVETVIGGDDYCMTTFWDNICQNSLDQCTLGCNADWHIPIIVSSGPAVYDCTAPAGYWTPNQACVEETIAADPFCVSTSWDSLCQGDYENCALGCSGAAWYVPYEVGSGPATLACSAPAGYYAPDATCLETVLLADNTCISDSWDTACQSEYNLCFYGCPDAVWSLPYEVGSGGAVLDCLTPFGYYEADQACIASVLADSPSCETSWDASCQSEYNLCFLGCTDAEWHIPLIVGDGPAVFECFTPAGYWTPDQACVQTVIAGDPFCTETQWDSICQESYESCALGCVDAQWYIPTTVSGPALLACSQPVGYEAPASLDCFFDVAANDPFCTSSFWDSFCQSAYDACTNGCTYEFACNYSPTAIFDDGSCGEPGCTDPSANNYNPDAVCDDGGCVFGGGSTCQGDLDGNNIVNSADLLVFLSAFGTSCPAVGP
jgi:hypothetical protein